MGTEQERSRRCENTRGAASRMGERRRASRTKQQSKVRQFELLERRCVMAADSLANDEFAVFHGIINSQSPTVSFDVNVSSSTFTLAQGTVSLNFHVVAESAGLQPAIPVVTNLATGQRVPPIVSSPNGQRNSESLVGLNLTPGTYRVTAAAIAGTVGAFRLETGLAGDVDGDRQVTSADCTAIQTQRNLTPSSPEYQVEADTNQDGRVDGFDYSRCTSNLGDRTTVRPLSLTVTNLNPSSALLPDGIIVTPSSTPSVLGTVNSTADLLVESTGNAGFDDGGSRVSSGDFSLALATPLAEGVNTIQVRATDNFGQQRSVTQRVIRDTMPPALSASLQNDTAPGGTTNGDGITHDATIKGRANDFTSGLGLFQARFGRESDSAWVNITSDLASDGSFTLSPQRLAELLGDSLSDGSYTLNLRVLDRAGNRSEKTVSFTLDRVLAPVNLTLAAQSDTGVLGDNVTTMTSVTLSGSTEPGASVQLQPTATTTSTNSTGSFQFSAVNLAIGANAFSVLATDAAGNEAQATITIRCDEPTTTAGWMLKWTETLLAAVRADRTPPPRASRLMAMQQLAVFDTTRGIAGQPGYYSQLVAPAGVAVDVAISKAARDVLVYGFPGQAARFDAVLARVLESVPDGTAKSQALAYGQNVAATIVAARDGDGWKQSVSYTPKAGPGYWQPTLPSFAPALLPQWANLSPFAMSSSSQFQPAGPPSLSSPEYAAALQETASLGSISSTTRTADQTEIALFWADGAGTATPPGHWLEIAIGALQSREVSSDFVTATLAKLSVALADAAIVAWNAKYQFEFWRPITAITAADTDGNDLTIADPNWRPLITTPPFPEYTSGHSTFSGAGAEILGSILGRDVSFSTTSDGLPGVTRSFSSFDQAADEAGRSRIYGGIHYEFANRDGLDSGRLLAAHVLQRFAVLEAGLAEGEGYSAADSASASTLLSGAVAMPSSGNRFSLDGADPLFVPSRGTGAAVADPIGEENLTAQDSYFAQLVADDRNERWLEIDWLSVAEDSLAEDAAELTAGVCRPLVSSI